MQNRYETLKRELSAVFSDMSDFSFRELKKATHPKGPSAFSLVE